MHGKIAVAASCSCSLVAHGDHIQHRHSPSSNVSSPFLSPYHSACNSGPDVIKSLSDAYPESKTRIDRRGRTPLHFALGSSEQQNASFVSHEVVALLSSTGATTFADDNGMLVSSRNITGFQDLYVYHCTGSFIRLCYNAFLSHSAVALRMVSPPDPLSMGTIWITLQNE